MQILQNNLAKQTGDKEEYDAIIAFGIFYVEKEFNVGPIDDKFPLLKFWNLYDEENIRRYKQLIDKHKTGGNEEIVTMG